MTYRIDGPIPVTLRPTEDGADLDVTRYLVQAVFTSLFEAADNNPEGFGEEFADMHSLALSAQRGGSDSHAWHEFDERMDAYLKEFADEGRIRLYAGGLRQLRDASKEIATLRPVPGQRSEGNAA